MNYCHFGDPGTCLWNRSPTEKYVERCACQLMSRTGKNGSSPYLSCYPFLMPPVQAPTLRVRGSNTGSFGNLYVVRVTLLCWLNPQ